MISVLSTERYEKYKDQIDFDLIYLLIRRGDIKCGTYAHRIKIKKNFKVGKELFTNGSESYQTEQGQRSEILELLSKTKE